MSPFSKKILQLANYETFIDKFFLVLDRHKLAYPPVYRCDTGHTVYFATRTNFFRFSDFEFAYRHLNLDKQTLKIMRKIIYSFKLIGLKASVRIQ